MRSTPPLLSPPGLSSRSRPIGNSKMRMARGDTRSTEQGARNIPNSQRAWTLQNLSSSPHGRPRRRNLSYSFADCDFLQQRSLHNSGDTVALADDGYQGRTAEKAWISNRDSYVASNLELPKRGSQQNFRHQVSGWVFQPPCFQYLGALGRPASWSR